MRRIKAFPRAWRTANGWWSAVWFAFATYYLIVDNDALFIGALILAELAVLEHRYLKPGKLAHVEITYGPPPAWEPQPPFTEPEDPETEADL